MKLTTSVLAGLVAVAILSVTGSPSNLDWVKERAGAKWRDQGFEVVDHEGHQWGRGGYGTPYGGAKVRSRLRKIPDNGITYSGYLVRWGDGLHVYGPIAVEAVHPR